MPRSKKNLKCYYGCKINGLLHRFPKPYIPDTYNNPRTDWFSQWKVLLDFNTKQMGDEYIHEKLRICDNHFETYYRLPSGRLTKNAVPTLNIPETLPVEHYTQTELLNEDNDIEETGNITPKIEMTQELTVMNEEDFPPVECQLQEPSTSTVAGPASNQIKIEESTENFTPYIYQKTIAQLTAKVERLNKKCELLKTIIREKNSLENLSLLRLLNKLPPRIRCFTKMQLKWATNPKGRRFTAEEKDTCFLVYTQSPDAYNLLTKMFVLPSIRVLNKSRRGDAKAMEDQTDELLQFTT